MKNTYGWSVRNKITHGKVFERNSYPKTRPKEEWIIKTDTGKIPAIIREEDFFKVQEIKENQINHKINKGIYRGVSEFASKIYCGKCGAVYHKNIDKGRHYYNCSSKRKYGVEKCNNHNLYLTKIDELITPEKYREALYRCNITYGQELLTLMYKLIQNLNSDDKIKVDGFKKELEEYKETKERILNAYIMKYINDSEFKQKVEPINKQISILEAQIEQYSKGNDERIKDLKDIEETISKFEEDHFVLTNQTDKEFAKKHTREDIIKDIKKMVVNEDGTVDIYYKTFDKYYELKEKHKNLLGIYVKDRDVEQLASKMKEKLKNYNKEIYNSNDILKVI